MLAALRVVVFLSGFYAKKIKIQILVLTENQISLVDDGRHLP